MVFTFLRRKRAARSIPVLTYHALHARGATYADNDHVALEEDLRVIREEGFQVVSLEAIVAALITRDSSLFARGKCVGVSFDDGTDFDFLDVTVPVIGEVKSFYRILVESGDRSNRGGGVLPADWNRICNSVARSACDPRQDLYSRS